MDNLFDYKFLQAYKELDSFCSDVFCCQNGVNEYINQMEMTPYSDRQFAPSFDYDYHMLKHCRHLRNQIAHDSLMYNVSTNEDLCWIISFRKRMWEKQDPFGIINTAKKEQRSKKSISSQVVSQNDDIQKDNSHEQGFFSRLINKIKHFFLK